MELRKPTSSSPRRNSQSQAEAFHMTTRRASKTTSANESSTSAASGSRSGSSRRNSMNESYVKDNSIPAATLSIDNIIGDDEQRYSKRRRVSMELKTPSHSSQGSQGSQHSSSNRSRMSTRNAGNLPPIDETPVPSRRSERNRDDAIQDHICVARPSDVHDEQHEDAAEDVSPRAIKRRKLSTTSRHSGASLRQSDHTSAENVIAGSYQRGGSQQPSAMLEARSQDIAQSSGKTEVDTQVRRSARLSQSSAEAERPSFSMNGANEQSSEAGGKIHDESSSDEQAADDVHTNTQAEDHDPQQSREITPRVATIAEAQVGVPIHADEPSNRNEDDEEADVPAAGSEEMDGDDPTADNDEAEAEDDGAEDAEGEDVEESEEQVEANKSPASAVDSQAAVPLQKGKPQKKMPGRRRHQHAIPTVEAALRRQLDLRVTYRAVAKQLKPILAEISKRTLKNLEKDRHYHEKASEHRTVLSQLSRRRDERLKWIEEEHSYQRRNLTRTFDEESELRRMRYNAEVADIQDRFIFHLQHDFLMAVRQEDQADDENASDDEEDDVIPSLHHVDTRGNVGNILGPAYHKRSRPMIETERLLDELELRLGVRRELDQIDEDGAREDPRPFTFLDPSLREGIEHDRQLNQLIEAVDELLKEPPKAPTPPPVIRNEEAAGLQALAAATDLRSREKKNPASPVVKQRQKSEPEYESQPLAAQRQVPDHRPEQQQSIPEHRLEQPPSFPERRPEQHIPFPEHRPEQHIPPLYGPPPPEVPPYRHAEYNHPQQYPPQGPPPGYWNTRSGPPPQSPPAPNGLPPLHIRTSAGPLPPASGAGTPVKTHFSSSPPVTAPQYSQIPLSQVMAPQTGPPMSMAPSQPTTGAPAPHSDLASSRQEVNGASTSQQALPGKAKLLPKPMSRPPSPTRQPTRSRQGSMQDAARPDVGQTQSGYRPVQRYETRPSLPPMMTPSEDHTTRTRSVSDTFGPILNPEPGARSPRQSRHPSMAQPRHEPWPPFRGPDPFRRSTVSGVPPGGNAFSPSSQHQSPALMQSRPSMSLAPTPGLRHSTANSSHDHRGPPQLLPRLPPASSPYGVPPPPMPYHQSPYASSIPGLPPPPQHHYPPNSYHPAPPGFPQGLPPPPLSTSSGPPPPGYVSNQAYGNGPPLLPAPGHPNHHGTPMGGMTAPSPQPGTPAFAQYQGHGRQDDRLRRSRNGSISEHDRERERYQQYYVGPR